MPVLPTYDSNRNIQANVAAPVRNEAAAPFQNLQTVFGAVKDVTQAWSDANDVMQATEAKAKHGVALADLETRAAADPDFKKSGDYYKELEEINKNAVAGINNKAVAGKIGQELLYDSTITKIKMQQGFQKKQLEYNKFTTAQAVDNIVRQKLSIADPETNKALVMQYDNQLNDLLSAQVAAGTLSYEEADKILKNSQETAVKYDIYNDDATQEKDSTILKQLKNPEGKYAFLDPDTRLKMIEESQRRIFQNNQTMKKESELTRDDRFNNIFTKANEGTLTLSDLDIEMAIPEEDGGIPKKQILDIRKSLQTRIKSDLEIIVENSEKAADYYEFINNFISDETDRQKGREAIVNAFKDGILSSQEASFLNSLKRETEDIKTLRSRDDFMSNKIIPCKNAINSINDFFTGKKNFTESEKAMAIKKILNRSSKNEDPQEAAQQVIKETIIEKNPAILNLSPEGSPVIDDRGNLKIMNNKADVEDYDLKPAATPSKKTSAKGK